MRTSLALLLLCGLVSLAAGARELQQSGGSAGDESWDNPGANEAGGDGEAPELTLASDLTDQWVLPAGELLEQDSDAATLGRVVQITSDEMPLLSLVGMSARMREIPPCTFMGPWITSAGSLELTMSGNLTRGLYNPISKKVYEQRVGAGDVSIRPKELVGYVINDECETAKHFAVWPSADPAVTMNLLGDLLKNLPADTLTSLLGASEAALDQLTKEAGQGGAMDECKKRCGLAA